MLDIRECKVSLTSCQAESSGIVVCTYPCGEQCRCARDPFDFAQAGELPHYVRDFGCGLPLRSRPQGASTSLRLKDGCAHDDAGPVGITKVSKVHRLVRFDRHRGCQMV